MALSELRAVSRKTCLFRHWPASFYSIPDHKLAKKELGQYPGILASRLVNYQYMLLSVQQQANLFAL